MNMLLMRPDLFCKWEKFEDKPIALLSSHFNWAALRASDSLATLMFVRRATEEKEGERGAG